MVDPHRPEVSQIARILQEKPEIPTTLLSVAKTLTNMQYREINIKVHAGNPQWVDKIESEGAV